jgi:hypothetical protein
LEDWGIAASVIDPSGVLWRIGDDISSKLSDTINIPLDVLLS